MTRFSAVIFIFFVAQICFLVAPPVQSANVLCMFTSHGTSQLIVFMAVANTLIDRGHNVTIITTIPIPDQSKPIRAFRHILLELSTEASRKLNKTLAEIGEEDVPKWRKMYFFTTFFAMSSRVQIDALKQDQFRQFLQEDNHFDLMLLGYYNNDYLVGVAARYQCPTAVIALGPPYGPINRMIGNPEETTYVQFPLFGRSQPMSFFERLTNFLWAVTEPLISILSHRMMECVYKMLFPDEFYPPFSEAITNVSLVLSSSHFSELPVRPLVPALVEIGGIQFKEHPDPLPEEIQAFLDSSTNGTILLNVGCKPRNSHLRQEKAKVIASTLAKLNQTALWEWNDDQPPPEAPNILLRRGLPQEGILAHNNTKVFITDGRSNCILGAQFRGVPMIGMPLYADEPYNVEDMTSSGFGVFVDVQSLTEDSLRQALDSVLNTPFYSARVKQFSRLYRDRLNTARETAAFWLEYVIRHQGAPHLKSPLAQMTFVQRWNIDVISVLAIGLYVFLKLANLIGVIVRFALEIRRRRRGGRICCEKYKCA